MGNASGGQMGRCLVPLTVMPAAFSVIKTTLYHSVNSRKIFQKYPFFLEKNA